MSFKHWSLSRKTLLLLPAAALGSTGAIAADQALEQRIEQLEQRLQEQESNSKTTNMLGNTEFNVGGYVKMDVIHSDYSNTGGAGLPNSRGRDFYVPALVPVDGHGHDRATDFHARESRVNLGTKTKIGEHTLNTFVEVDFFGETYDTLSGNRERLTNSMDPRLRHAFIEWEDGKDNKWLFGQTWTNFMDVGTLPETLDFIGAVDGMALVRQAQVRWTHGPVSLALENPNSTVHEYNSTTRLMDDHDRTPDFTFRYTQPLGDDLGHVGVSALAREIRLDNTGRKDETFGYAVSLNGKFNFASGDDIRMQLNYGDGIGRYLGLNTASGAVLDSNDELETIKAYGGYFALHHPWDEKWRSNVAYSYFEADNDSDYTHDTITKRSQSVHANLIYQVLEPLSLGVEYVHAIREIENGASGYANRYQFSAKLDF